MKRLIATSAALIWFVLSAAPAHANVGATFNDGTRDVFATPLNKNIPDPYADITQLSSDIGPTTATFRLSFVNPQAFATVQNRIAFQPYVHIQMDDGAVSIGTEHGLIFSVEIYADKNGTMHCVHDGHGTCNYKYMAAYGIMVTVPTSTLGKNRGPYYSAWINENLYPGLHVSDGVGNE